MKKLVLTILLLSMLGCAGGPAGPPDGVHVGALQVLEDPSGRFSIHDMLMMQDTFVFTGDRKPNFFFTREAYWFKLSIENTRTETVRLFMDMPYPTLDYVALYVFGSQGIQGPRYAGDRIPAAHQPFPAATTLVLPFELKPGETADLFVRVHGDAHALLFPYQIRDEESLSTSILTIRLFHGIVIGIFISLLMYNHFLYVILREPSRLYYMAYLPFSFLAFTAIDGFGPAVLYPMNTWFANEGFIFFLGIASFFALLFTRVFLQTAEGVVLDRWIKLLLAISLLMIISSLILPASVTYPIGMLMLFLIPLILLLFSLVAWRGGRTEVRFYALAQFVTWMGSCLFALMIIDVLPYHWLLLEAIPIGISVGALLHSLAIADRIRLLEKETIRAQETARQNLELRQEELERLVLERTEELDHARRRAERQATTDLLTGVYNRRGLLVAAERVMKMMNRQNRPLAVAIIDLDHFKLVNDRFGHLEGDRILRDVAFTISQEIRSTDLFGRVGGEEFLLIMPDTPPLAALELAERLRAHISLRITVGDPPEAVTASFGVAWLRESIHTLRDLVEDSDKALYLAKQKGRNRVESLVVP